MKNKTITNGLLSVALVLLTTSCNTNDAAKTDTTNETTTAIQIDTTVNTAKPTEQKDSLENNENNEKEDKEDKEESKEK